MANMAKFRGIIRIIQLSNRRETIPFQNDESHAGPTGPSYMICLV